MKRQVSNRLSNSTLLAVIAAAILFALVQTLSAHAQLTELYGFQYNAATTSNYPDGQTPMAELIQGADGNYYTTTFAGGSGGCPSEVEGTTAGCGTVVKITPTGTLSVVYSFPYDSTTNAASNGMGPQAGLLQASDGNFYGVTTTGGTEGASFCTTSVGITGCGTIFKLSPKGKLTVLHDFCGPDGCGSLTTDGALATGRLVEASNGYLYGTTQSGGFADSLYNQGTIFRISRSGSYEILHLFTGAAGTGDGENPTAGLTLGSDGNFYGTTEAGGSGGEDEGEGTVFKMTPAGTVTILHSFVGLDGAGSDGSYPKGALVEASDGNLYGTCYSGGANGTGTAFRISMKGVFTKIYDFPAQGASDSVGNYPQAGFIQASDGNLYGTALDGGAFGEGTIYQITTAGVATLEASFDPSVTGFAAVDALVQGDDGRLYVTLQDNGGSNSDGVQDQGAISVLSLGLAPPPPAISNFSPTSGKVGAKVTIEFGPYIGATSVTFNGTPATFVVEGSEFITATVPTGATTGPISVTTPGGTVTSTKSFTIP
jgi:uncharacterized repeat protein (TIGR03803 family)